MKPYIYNLILVTLAGAALIIPFTGKVHDARYKWLKSFTIRGWLLILSIVSSIIITYFKDAQTEKDEHVKADNAKKEQRALEIDNRKLTDQSNAKIVNTFTEALAKHGLKYDSVEMVIERMIKDSTKKEIKNIFGNHPEVSVYDITLKKNNSIDSISFEVTILVKNSTAYHLTLRSVFVLDEYGKPFKIIAPGPNSNFVNDVQISPDNKFLLTESFTGRILPKSKLFFYFYYYGTYKDLDNKQYPVKILVSYNMENSSFETVMEPTQTSLKAFLKSKGITSI